MTLFAPYDLLASEYYDASHKTSRNFDHTSMHCLQAVRARVPENGEVLEVGAGRGRSGEFLGIPPGRVVQLDSSARMLAVEPREQCVLRVVHRAEVLPFMSSTFSCVTTFLCDPFLGLEFLSEAQRVLQQGGMLIGTTPAYEWGAPLREELEIGTATARFLTRSGTVLVPSVLLPRQQLREMLQVAGFGAASVAVTAHRLPRDAEPISPDIEAPAKKLGCDVHELDILYAFVCTK